MFKNKSEKFQIMLLVIYFPISIFTIEMLAHLNFFSGFNLLLKNPFAFLLNTVLFATITYFFLALFKKQTLVFTLMTVISFLIGLGTKLKIDFRGVGLNILDFLVIQEAGGMINNLSTSFIITASIMVLILTILFVYIIGNMPKIMLSSKIRRNGILAFILVSLFLYFLGPYTVTIKSAGIKRKLYIEESGSLYYFAAQIKNTTSLKSPSEEEVTNVLRPIIEASPIKEDTIKPDILIIQSESFTDPTLIGMENFSADPLPYFHSLQKVTNSFGLSVPSFAGGTANTEFEVVTGMSTMFFPSDATVYANYMTKPTISIGSILKNNGYTASLLHPFHSTFYSRDNAYKLLGFDKFYGLEYLADFKSVDIDTRYWDSVDDYMTDSMLYQHVIKELEQETDESKFILTLSMQNHTPFVVPEGYEDRITYTGDGLTNDVAVRKYNAYLSSLKASDDALSDLISYLSKREKPTIVLFYGDHYPKVNQNGNAYIDLGLVSDLSSPENDYITHVTPAFIWSNYKDVGKSDRVIDGSLVSAKLLALTGVEVPNYMKINNYLESLNINSMTNAYIVMNNQFYNNVTEEYKQIYQLYSMINGDILGDDKFLETKEWFIKENENYINPK
ncbi:MAG: phosphoglycerol transferase family protein alkaline phosphatase superfamily [Fusobacteria bacterium]|nr:MAG: phosphoglycerol transferase family protein alkaline phosphatase superfamily [Fusobacteriota bacterium]KAF0227879.1 MAG: phosphoglycerol transferase family protein alkaline phosphatase [Fusobacteriota bacterium]